MGYTHYFPGLRATADLCVDARKIVAASDIAICGPRGDGLPVISESEGIRLNGAKAAGGACETFRLIGTSGPASAVLPDSCKTNGKPYDEVVTAILLAAAVRLMNVRAGAFTSDGRWDNWTAGAAPVRTGGASTDRGRKAGVGARRGTDAPANVPRLTSRSGATVGPVNMSHGW